MWATMKVIFINQLNTKINLVTNWQTKSSIKPFCIIFYEDSYYQLIKDKQKKKN